MIEAQLAGVDVAGRGVQVDRDVVADVERHDFGARSFHEVRQRTGGGTELEHATTGEVDVAEVLVLAAAEVPRTRDNLTIRQLDRVVEAAIGARQRGALVGEARW